MKVLLPFLFVFFLAGCGQEKEDEIFFLRHKGADMQLWVRGNIDAKVFVLFLHGGPGYSSFPNALNNDFSPLEQDYAVVYWEQRSSGTSQGHSDSDLISVEQYKEDLGLVVDLLKQKYSGAKIVLMGHSWGGLLGPAWLLDGSNQSKVAAWIEVDGAHDLGQESYQHSEDFVVAYAEEQLTGSLSKDDRNYWNKALAFYEKTSMWSKGLIPEHAGYVHRARGYYRDPSYSAIGSEEIFFSPGDFMGAGAFGELVVSKMDMWGRDYTGELSNITIPTLVLWGKYDGILTVALAYEAREAYGIPDDRLVIFERSGHSPFVEEKAKFNRAVLDFLEEVL